MLAAYGVLLWAPIIYDDKWYLFALPEVTGPWPGLRAFFAGSLGDAGDYSPLVVLLHWAMHRAFGLDPLAYRLTSLALHAAVAVLVGRAVRRRVGRDDLAFAAALLWALFPSHVEVLAQTSFKKHQLVALCALLILEIRARWKDSPRRAAACAALLVPAALCRESAVMIVPLFAADCWFSSEGLKKNRLTLGALAAAGAAYAVLHSLLVPRALTGLMGGDVPSHLLTGAKLAAWHASQMVLPVLQCQEHSIAPARPSEPGAWAVLLFLAALAAAAWKAARHDRDAAFGLAWTAIFLAPFFNLVPYLNFSLAANRYHYMASAGAMLFFARLAERLKPSPKAAAYGTACVAIVYTAIGMPHAALYAAPLDLWAQTAACAPDNTRAHAGYGNALREAGRLVEAEAELNRAIELDPEFGEPYVDLTWVHAELGHPEAALAAARRRVAIRPADAGGLGSLGTLELSLGRVEDACPHLAEAFRLLPSQSAAFGLGQCRAAQGRLDEAEMNLRLAASGPVEGLRARSLAELGALLLRRGDKDGARRALTDSLDLDGIQPEALARLGTLDAPEARRRLDLAVERLEAAPGETERRAAAPVLASLRAKRAALPK